jgi:hypothetical protein
MVLVRLDLGPLMAVVVLGIAGRRLLRWTVPGGAVVPPPH